MNTEKFVAELKMRAIGMYEFLEGEEDRARKAAQQAMDQASAELSMQGYAQAIDAVGGKAEVEALLFEDLMAMEQERLSLIVGKITRDELEHPGNIAHYEIKALREGQAEREHLLKLAGYYEGVLRWAEFPIAMWGEQQERREIEARLVAIQDRLGEPAPIVVDRGGRLRRLYGI